VAIRISEGGLYKSMELVMDGPATDYGLYKGARIFEAEVWSIQ